MHVVLGVGCALCGMNKQQKKRAIAAGFWFLFVFAMIIICPLARVLQKGITALMRACGQSVELLVQSKANVEATDAVWFGLVWFCFSLLLLFLSQIVVS